MYDIRRQTQKFNTDSTEELREYDEILNDPLCTIVKEYKEKISEKKFSEEGNIASIHEYVILVVTWDEKVLL
jgi:hypothetical protein